MLTYSEFYKYLNHVLYLFQAGAKLIPDLLNMFIMVFLTFIPAVVDSSLGMGYGFTVTPLLLLLDFSPLKTVPAVLFSSLVGDLLSSYYHHQFKNVDFSVRSRSFKIAIVMGSLGSIGAFFGALVATGISKFYLSLYIGALVTFLGFFVLFSRKMKIGFSWSKVIALGVLGAFNKGLSGSGFGPVITTGGLMAGIDEKAAVSIQSLSESFVAVVGFLTFALSGTQIDWYLVLSMSIGVALSAPVAAYFVHKIDSKKLRSLIAFVAILLGTSTLVRLFL